ncbi:Prefoldin alpha-like [Trema orientale]|uniref:Prefoldin alpha-like n=1 Tax=Trema orientale TaxID=63057 RepID=A0A2P5G0C6_TREOI|nr:Prefoldin alpha-like [Trema orientale]
MDNYRQEKVQKFEEFVDSRLKPDLVRAIAERDKVFEQQKIFSDLRKNIETLEKNSVTSLRTQVNLGSEVYMQADVPDTRRIFVDIGLGFHAEFTWSEALNYISLREEKISRQIEEYTRLIASIKTQIKLVYEGIRELLQLPAEKPLPEQFSDESQIIHLGWVSDLLLLQPQPTHGIWCDLRQRRPISLIPCALFYFNYITTMSSSKPFLIQPSVAIPLILQHRRAPTVFFEVKSLQSGIHKSGQAMLATLLELEKVEDDMYDRLGNPNRVIKLGLAENNVSLL